METTKLEVFTINQDVKNSNIYPFTMHGNMLSVDMEQYNPQQFYNSLCMGDVTASISKESYPKNFMQDYRANIKVVSVPNQSKRQADYIETEKNKMRACKLYRILFGFMVDDTVLLDKTIKKIFDHVQTHMTSLPIAIKEIMEEAIKGKDICSRLSLFLIAIVACVEIRNIFLPVQEWHTIESVKHFITSGDPENIETYFNIPVVNYHGPKVVQVDPYIAEKYFMIVKTKFFEYISKQGTGKNCILEFVVECLIEYLTIFRITPFHIVANKIRHMQK